jgi:hypothetical protein
VKSFIVLLYDVLIIPTSPLSLPGVSLFLYPSSAVLSLLYRLYSPRYPTDFVLFACYIDFILFVGLLTLLLLVLRRLLCY